MSMLHPIVIGAPRDFGLGSQPAVLQRSDDDFIAATLDELRSAEGRARLHGQRAQARDAQGRWKLFQPIQRQFHLVLIEGWCETPGTPRIDPARIDAAGLVLRRLGADGQPQGWMRSRGRLRGWVPLARIGGDALDPEAAQRLAGQRTGVADIDERLRGLALALPDKLLDEAVTPLFPAPPDVCRDAAKTLLYGVVSTTSGELSESPATLTGEGEGGDDFGPGSALFRQHLVEALRGAAMELPFAGQALKAGWFDAMEAVGDATPEGVSAEQASALRNTASDDSRRMRRFLLLLRQLSGEFDAFAGGAEPAALKGLLRAIRLPLVAREGDAAPRHVEAYDFLAKAHALLLQQEPVAGEVEMPQAWPALGADDAARLVSALHAAMQARFTVTQGRVGRFDEPGARYVLRAFVRLKPEGGCPARTVWSAYSDPFVIAPWWDGAGAPPVQIALPDPSDKGLLKSLKPNVAFVVPPSLQNLLGGSAKDLLEGKGSTSGPGITWICSFSLPIITICAFIVLNIFLTLFNIVFGWMFFLKICIPFPKIGNKPPGG